VANVKNGSGVFARTGPGTNYPIGPGGGDDGKGNDRDPRRAMAPWKGMIVAVLQKGIKQGQTVTLASGAQIVAGPGASEWWRVYTPGGYELFVAGVPFLADIAPGTPPDVGDAPMDRGTVDQVGRSFDLRAAYAAIGACSCASSPSPEQAPLAAGLGWAAYRPPATRAPTPAFSRAPAATPRRAPPSGYGYLPVRPY
jgi:hypothetical protein